MLVRDDGTTSIQYWFNVSIVSQKTRNIQTILVESLVIVGILWNSPREAIVLMTVMVTLRLTSPPSSKVHMLLEPPPGAQPDVKKPRADPPLSLIRRETQ